METLTNFKLNPSHYILDESNFNFRYVRLCDLDTPRKKMTKLFADRGGIGSGSVLFAYYPFRDFQTTMGRQHFR